MCTCTCANNVSDNIKACRLGLLKAFGPECVPFFTNTMHVGGSIMIVNDKSLVAVSFVYCVWNIMIGPVQGLRQGEWSRRRNGVVVGAGGILYFCSCPTWRTMITCRTSITGGLVTFFFLPLDIEFEPNNSKELKMYDLFTKELFYSMKKYKRHVKQYFCPEKDELIAHGKGFE